MFLLTLVQEMMNSALSSESRELASILFKNCLENKTKVNLLKKLNISGTD